MGPEGWRWVWLGSVRFFLGMEENIYGEEWTRARDTVKLSWLGLEADMPSLVGGHKATVEGNTVEAPDQDKDLGRTMSLLRESPADWGQSTRLEPCVWNTAQQGKNRGHLYAGPRGSHWDARSSRTGKHVTGEAVEGDEPMGP